MEEENICKINGSRNDIEIPVRTWNEYLKKYKCKYQIRQDELGIWQIRCKYGNIQTYSINKKQLCFVGEFPTKNKKTFFLKKLRDNCVISQEGMLDVVILFDEALLDSLSSTFCCYKKRNLSNEYRKELTIRIEKARNVKKLKNKEKMIINFYLVG